MDLETRLNDIRAAIHRLGWLDEGSDKQAEAILEIGPLWDALIETAANQLGDTDASDDNDYYGYREGSF